MIASSLPAKRFQSSSYFQPRQNKWELDRVLSLDHKIPQPYFTNAPIKVVDSFCRMLSRDVYSEGDAQILYDYLLSLRNEMSGDFLFMLKLWL